jgi:hypothetical protein
VQSNFNGRPERGDLFLDRVREAVDLLIEEVDVREDRADPQRVQLVEATLERLFERGQLLAQPAFGELGEQLGVGRAMHERVEHRAARDAEDVARDAIELDPGVLQRLVQPVGLPGTFLDLRLAIPGQVAQIADRLGRDEARLQQPGLQQLAQPRRIADVGLASGDLLDVSGVDQHQREVVLEHMPDGLPEHAGRLHHNPLDTISGQPVAKREQPANRRLELGHVLLATLPVRRRHPHARGHLLLVNIQRPRALNDRVHQTSRGRRKPSPPMGP